MQHQVAELWMKLLLHELHSARALLAADDLGPALKRLARVKHVQKQLVEQWDVLATLTPSEYALIRPFLATSSGFQSHQYRAVEFLLGNKNADMVRVFEHSPAEHASLRGCSGSPRCTTSSCATSPAAGMPCRRRCSSATSPSPTGSTTTSSRCSRRSTPRRPSTGASTRPARSSSTSRTCSSSGGSGTCRSSSRTIGHKQGTGGSSGVDFLRRALDLTFFPELYAVRVHVE